jgi:16S rRNA (guanine1207-N2)-methyltransferase
VSSGAFAFSFDDLRRWPDLESHELRAWDTADILILNEADGLLAGADITVIGDEYGALTLGALDRGAAAVRVHQDRLSGEFALAANGKGAYKSLPLDATLLDGATLVLLRLPRSLDALDEIAAT